MSNSIAMRVPSGITSVYSSKSLQTYTADANGYIVVDPTDVPDLLRGGFLLGLKHQKYVAKTDTLDATAVAGDVSGADNVHLNMTGALGAGKALTLPTVAALVAGLPGAFIGQTFRLRIINSSSGNYAWTVTTNTGWTLNGTMTVAQNTFRDFIVTLTSLTAATLQQVGTGTNS